MCELSWCVLSWTVGDNVIEMAWVCELSGDFVCVLIWSVFLCELSWRVCELIWSV